MTLETMRLNRVFVLLFSFFLSSGCAVIESNYGNRQCSVSSLVEVQNDPVSYAGQVYCGRAFIRSFGRATIIVDRIDVQPSLDTTMLIVDGLEMLGPVSDTPREYDIRAKIDILPSCYSPREERASGPSGECIPYRRPIFFELRAARPAS